MKKYIAKRNYLLSVWKKRNLTEPEFLEFKKTTKQLFADKNKYK